MATQVRSDVCEPLRATQTERLQRRRGIGADKFHIPPELIPEGMSLEWKRMETVGAPDLSHQIALAENHWTPVSTDQVPGLMPPGYSGVIKRDGQQLMMRPSYLSDEAREEVLDEARRRVNIQKQRNGQGGAEAMPRSKPTMRTQMEPLSSKVYEARQIPA